MKLLYLIMLMFFIGTVSAQTVKTSPFKHIPPPERSTMLKASLSNSVTAYRFVLPFAGYSPITKQISTGIGYGWNKMHYVDSTASYYTDLSIFGALLVDGNVTPTIYNFTSVGVGVGLFNGLINVIPSYHLSNADHKDGFFNINVSVGLTLK